jgi:hypothetical protein
MRNALPARLVAGQRVTRRAILAPDGALEVMAAGDGTRAWLDRLAAGVAARNCGAIAVGVTDPRHLFALATVDVTVQSVEVPQPAQPAAPCPICRRRLADG